MEYDGLRYIKIYSTGASASSLGIPLPRWGVDCICAIFYNIGSRMDPNLKQRIIEEAYRLFITKGMKQTSFCDVAVAVHKSKGAVIHYFPSKKKLIDAVVRMRFFPDSQISCEMYSLADKDWNEFLRQYRNPIERVINSFPKHLNGNLLVCYMQFVSSAHEYMDEFPQMYQQLLVREQDFLSNVAYDHKISLKDAKAFSRQTLNTSIGKTFLRMFSEI